MPAFGFVPFGVNCFAAPFETEIERCLLPNRQGEQPHRPFCGYYDTRTADTPRKCFVAKRRFYLSKLYSGSEWRSAGEFAGK